jgi:cobalamin biosynthetic protein CobC
MLIDPHIRAPSLTPLMHGGDLVAARQMFPDAPEPFIDLSTGINPHPYPLPPLPADIFARLPDRAAIRRLAAVAAQNYGAPTADRVVPAPGAQILLPKVAMLVAPGRAAILGPTYAEHLRAARLVGHDAVEVSEIAQLRGADLAIVVNPNNPDGRIVSKATLLGIADDLRRRGGILVVDESFADVAPEGVSLSGDTADNIVVLRSFGKFFGLAGLRLGFALAAPDIANRLDASLGPWAVAGPAILIGQQALADRPWQSRTRENLAATAGRLDSLLAGSGLEILGGTSLFRLTRCANAGELFMHLGRAGVLLRRFLEDASWLRWGLPRSEAEWQRLSAALTAFRFAS